jgi:hypothetical protein
LNEIIAFQGLGHVVLEVFEAFLPLLVILFICHFLYLKLPREMLIRILSGMLMSFIGLTLFLQGVQIGFLPAGEAMGEYLGKLSYNWIIIPIGLLLGLVATVAEPAVRILNHQVETLSGGYVSQKTMLYTLAIGVAISVALAMIRIIYGIPLLYILLPGYLLALILIKFSSPTFIAVAFDSGGVATGPMTVTFVMAFAVGAASGMAGRDPLLEGFGMIALVAMAPILSVLVLGLIYEKRSAEAEYESR